MVIRAYPRQSLRRLARWTARMSPDDEEADEQYSGRLVILFGGHGVYVKGKPLSILIFLIICTVSGLYFGFTAPWIWHNISPAIVAVVIYLFLLTVSFFIRASLADPGILPKSIHPVDEQQLPAEYTVGVAVPRRFTKRSEGSKSEGRLFVKYCETCRIWRPARSAHCSQCDRCIDILDHHCMWLNNCVGRRNYRFFLGFIWSVTLLCYLISSTCWYHLIEAYKLANTGDKKMSFATSASRTRVSFLLAIFTTFAGLFPMLMIMLHLFLGYRAQTTREYLRKSDWTLFASEKGPLWDLFVACCRSRGGNMFINRAWNPSSHQVDEIKY